MAPSWKFRFDGRILFIGYGSVTRCTLPLIERHFDMPLSHVTVIDAEDRSVEIAPFVAKGVNYVVEPIFRKNMAAVLARYVGHGDLILNLSVEVSSIDVMAWCQKNRVLYLDTCIEPWANYYDNPKIPEEQRTNYFLRYTAREKAKKWGDGATSALITHGANPGLISHFVKQGLLEIAKRKKLKVDKPRSREEWAALAQRVGTKVIHVAEHDLQVANAPKRPGEFVNTWSIPGFTGEGAQPAELGWGSHEKRLPPDGNRHKVGPKCAIYLDRPGCMTQVRSWTPIGGPMTGFLITHGEAITLADYLTVWKKGRAVYRPTVHYAYHPTQRRRALGARVHLARFPGPVQMAADERGDRRGHRRAGRAADGRSRRALVRLPAFHRGGARAPGPAIQRDLDPDRRARAGRRHLADRASRGRPASSPRISTMSSCSRSASPISAPWWRSPAIGPRSRAAASSSPSPASTGRTPGSSRTSG